MSNFFLQEEVERCADKIGCNAMVRAIMANVWLEFERTIASGSSRPHRLQAVDLDLLAGFIEVRSKKCVDVEVLLLEITCIRMALLESGFLHNQLGEIRVRITRERLANDENGKYRFAKKLCA